MTGFDIRRVPYDHPDPQTLTAEVQAFYVQLYGGPDRAPFRAAEFAPPHGRFLVGYLDDTPVAMGGWRFARERVPAEALRPAELKRMYVRQGFRGRGLARRLLAALEGDAAGAGADWLILQTATPQFAAVELYRSSGYTSIQPFGFYARAPDVVNLGKRLGGERPA